MRARFWPLRSISVNGGRSVGSANAVRLPAGCGSAGAGGVYREVVLDCQVNERVAIEQPEVEKALGDNNVLLLKADWTRYDDVIRQALAGGRGSRITAYALSAPGQEGIPGLFARSADAGGDRCGGQLSTTSNRQTH